MVSVFHDWTYTYSNILSIGQENNNKDKLFYVFHTVHTHDVFWRVITLYITVSLNHIKRATEPFDNHLLCEYFVCNHFRQLNLVSS